MAGLPDNETYEYIKKRYSLFLETTRDGCVYYANPKQITRENSIRFLSVLLTQGAGTICNGIMEFQTLRVDCKNNLISYNNYVGSSYNWQEEKPYQNTEIARKICRLPSRKLQ